MGEYLRLGWEEMSFHLRRDMSYLIWIESLSVGCICVMPCHTVIVLNLFHQRFYREFFF